MSISLEALSQYPHTKGVSGIDFVELANSTLSIPRTEGGYDLADVVISDERVTLKDRMCPQIRMYGLHYYPANAIRFSLQRRAHEGGWKHPDFNMDAFMSTVANHFVENGKLIERLFCTWTPASVNYKKFEELLTDGHNIESALWGTWSGNKASKLGFQRIEKVPDNILKRSLSYEVTFAK